MLAIALISPAPSVPAYAADAAKDGTGTTSPAQNGPLKPGRSAGVRAAQLPRTGVALVGASAIIAVVVVAASNGGGNNQQPNMQSVPVTTSP